MLVYEDHQALGTTFDPNITLWHPSHNPMRFECPLFISSKLRYSNRKRIGCSGSCRHDYTLSWRKTGNSMTPPEELSGRGHQSWCVFPQMTCLCNRHDFVNFKYVPIGLNRSAYTKGIMGQGASQRSFRNSRKEVY